MYDDYRFSEEAQERDLKVIWKCSQCGLERTDYPGCNEGGAHAECGGEWQKSGESYLSG